MSDDFDNEVTEARVLPLNAGGNIICGRVGYDLEIANRIRMNRENNLTGAKKNAWDLPAWESLKVYFAAGEYV